MLIETQHFNFTSDRVVLISNQQSKINNALLLLSVEIDEQIWGFIDADAVQLCFLELRFQALPDCDCQIFRGRNLSEKFRDLLVEEAVVHGVEHFVVHHFLELLEIDDETRVGIDLALYRDFQRVVVAVPVRVVALSEDAAILFGRKVGIVIIVRGGEFSFAG